MKRTIALLIVVAAFAGCHKSSALVQCKDFIESADKCLDAKHIHASNQHANEHMIDYCLKTVLGDEPPYPPEQEQELRFELFREGMDRALSEKGCAQ